MTIVYSAEALSKDVSSPFGCISGCANIAVIKEKIEESNIRDPVLISAVEQLTVYFHERSEAFGENVLKLAWRQEIGGEHLDGAEAEVLQRSATRKIPTTINKRTAKELAKLIWVRARAWND
jgi:hypothetical protein